MGDEHHAHSLAALNVADQLQDLRLGGHVECGRRLVRDQDRGLERQGHGDHHPLPLPARKPERILMIHELRIGQTHFSQQVDGAAATRFRGADAMRRHDLGDLRAHGHQRIERRERVLKDHRHNPAAQVAQLVGRHADDVHPVQVDCTRGDADHPGQKPHDRIGCDRLPRSRFADDAQDLAALRSKEMFSTAWARSMPSGKLTVRSRTESAASWGLQPGCSRPLRYPPLAPASVTQLWTASSIVASWRSIDWSEIRRSDESLPYSIVGA